MPHLDVMDFDSFDSFGLFDEFPSPSSYFSNLAKIHLTGKVNSFKNKGNMMMKGKQYSKAIELYTEAINLQRQNLGILEAIDEAHLWSNRSAAYIATGKYKEALQDAECCISADPHWFKGYIRKANAYDQLGNILEAAHAHIEAINANLKVTECKYEGDIYMEMLISALTSLQKLYKTDEEIACSLLLDIMDRSILPVFRTLIEIIIDKKLFEILIFLHSANQLALCEEKPRNFVDILEADEFQWEPFQEDALICCFKSGIFSVSDISAYRDGTYFHFFVILSLASGSTRILEYVLNDIFTTKEQCEILDELGRSIIHSILDNIVRVQIQYIYATLTCLAKYPHIDLLMVNKDGLPVTKCYKYRQHLVWRQALRFCIAHEVSKKSTELQNEKKSGEKKLLRPYTTDVTVEEGSSKTPRSTGWNTFNKISEVKGLDEHISKHDTRDTGNKLPVKTTSEPSSVNKSGNVSATNVKFLIPSRDITMEANILQIPNVLHKLGVINLI